MAEFVLHSIPGSPFGRAVIAAFLEKGQPFRFAAVAPGTLKGPEHMARHPFGRIPVIEHGDFKLFETQAILRYIDRVCPGPALTPADPKAAALVDQAMNVSDWYFFQGVGNTIGFQRAVKPRLMKMAADEAVCAEALPYAHKVFDELSRLLGDKPYFAGESFSLADIQLGTLMDFFPGAPEWEPLTAQRGNLVAWLERLNARPSFKESTWEAVAAMAA